MTGARRLWGAVCVVLGVALHLVVGVFIGWGWAAVLFVASVIGTWLDARGGRQ